MKLQILNSFLNQRKFKPKNRLLLFKVIDHECELVVEIILCSIISYFHIFGQTDSITNNFNFKNFQKT